MMNLQFCKKPLWKEDASKQFIREIRTLCEHAIVVGRDRQLIDLVRFCTFDEEFGIMTVDPTFSLGEFDVTLTTYRHFWNADVLVIVLSL